MHNIQLTYKRKYLPGYAKIKIKHPEKWTDVTPAQFIDIAYILTTQNNISNKREYLSNVFLNLKLLLMDMPEQLLKLSDFLNQECPPVFFVKKIKHLNAPKNMLSNVTFGQFVFADSYYMNYQQSKDYNVLCKLIASIYLPKGIEFTEDIITTNAKLIQKVNPRYLNAILFNYQIVRHWITQQYPAIFAKQAIVNQPIKIGGKQHTWVDVFKNIVGSDIINEDKYAKLNIHTVLNYINRKLQQ